MIRLNWTDRKPGIVKWDGNNKVLGVEAGRDPYKYLESISGQNVEIGDYTTITEKVKRIGSNVRIGNNCVIKSEIVPDNSIIDHGTVF